MQSFNMIPFIGAASGIGGRDPRCEEGPLFLKEHLGTDFLWKAMILPNKNVHDKYEAICSLNRSLAEETFSLAKNNRFFISVGGDHSCAIGTWSGVAAAKKEEGEIGLLWVDAHMDSHTPETSETGNIHGMPLAALMGYGDKRLTNILNPFPKLKPHNVALIGIRSFESGEAKLLETLGVRIYFMEEVRARGLQSVMREAQKLVSQNTIGYGISFDLDSLDPLHIPAVATPEPEGIDPAEIWDCVPLMQKFPPLAFELVEYIPALDHKLETVRFIQQFLSAVTNL